MDEAVFTRTAKAYKDRLFAIAFHYCRSRADAEDILQTVLLKYYRSEKEFGTEEYLRNWLIRVTINESKRLLLSHWRRRTVPLAIRETTVQTRLMRARAKLREKLKEAWNNEE